MMMICRLQPKNSLNGGWVKLYPILKSNMVSLAFSLVEYRGVPLYDYLKLHGECRWSRRVVH